MYQSSRKSRSTRLVALSVTAVAALAFSAGNALAIKQSGEQKDMRRVGHTDLQGRAAYHPDFITYPDGRVIAFVGTHSSANPSNPPINPDSNLPKPNPLKAGSPVEPNGTMIIDVTDPKNPVEKFHIPGPVASGASQTQSNRMCLGSDLPGGMAGHVYLLRNVQGGGAAAGYEVWDVTNVTNPVLVAEMRGLRNTHKPWWECTTGVAYLPGSLGTGYGVPQWRQGQSMLVVDWSNPTTPPVYLRTFGLPGGQPAPNGTGPVPTSLHGAISAREHPNAAGNLARGTGVIGNRIYLAWGVGSNGVMQVLDRNKLLPPLSNGRGGVWNGINPDTPTNAELEVPQTSILYMSPDQGGHTSFPVFGMMPKSYQDFTAFLTRDIVLLASESTNDECIEAPHWSFAVDVTVENSIGVRQNPWQGPMVLSTMSLDPRAGEKWPRGNYCDRGARFGVHSSEENFRNPYYGKLTFLAYFTGGVRAWDIREPQAPVEVAFYVPESNANTEPAGYMTNNLEVDNRGYIFAVDRNGAGFDILELHGKAQQIGVGK